MVLRLRTLLAKAHGNIIGYSELLNRYRAQATSPGLGDIYSGAESMP
jgi:hypothetical protein